MNILITGANGFLGGKITKRITDHTDFNVIAAAASEEKVREMCVREGVDHGRVRFLSNEELLEPGSELKDVYGAVHLAFARRIRPAEEIASSVVFAAEVFRKLADLQIERVINMSSQGIYGVTEKIRTEDTVPAPETPYTMAKYAVEVLFDEFLKRCPHHTSLRLDPVVQSQNVIRGLCKSAKEGRISLKGGKQVFSFIDGEDAATAVVAMLKADGDWNRAYNVGWNRKRYTLLELTEIIADSAERCGYRRPEIELTEADIFLWAGMDSSRFMDKTGWKPVIGLEESIAGIIQG